MSQQKWKNTGHVKTALTLQHPYLSEQVGEHGQNDRQQVRLVADAGYWGSDRLSHAPIQTLTSFFIDITPF